VLSEASLDAGALDRSILALEGGGGTPLRQAVLDALALCDTAKFRPAHVAKRLLLLTDGRTREDLDDLGRRCRELDVLVVDCESGALRLERARRLASALGGRHVHVEALLGS
jgi:Mg-chelatase subunit ChlD